MTKQKEALEALDEIYKLPDTLMLRALTLEERFFTHLETIRVALTNPDTVTIKRSELEKLRIAHYSCEDSWHSCPKSEDGCCNDMWSKDECNCGADKHNAIIETALEKK
jgi:hypothetical protein